MRDVDILRNIYYNKRHHYYIAEALFFYNEKNERIYKSFINDKNVSKNEKFWLAMCYIKFKSSSIIHSNIALEIIYKSKKYIKEITKLLLKKT